MRTLPTIIASMLCSACLAQQGGAPPVGERSGGEASTAASEPEPVSEGREDAAVDRSTARRDEIDFDAVEEIDIESLPPVAEETCLSSREIRRFSALSDEFVLLEARRDEYYLLTLFPGCIGVRSSIEIALISDLDRVCSNSAASIGYRGVRGRETCPIQRIERVEDRASAERLVETRSR